MEQLHACLQLPPIREFWDDGDRTLAQVRSHYFQEDQVKRYIICFSEQAVGCSQAYVIDPTHEYIEFGLPSENTMGIDYFIGSTKFLGRGFAIPILREFIKSYCPVKRILVDPAPENRKAINFYKKSGFIKIGEHTVNNRLHAILIYCKE